MEEKNPDTFLLNETLQKVVKGTGIVFIGSILGTLMAFIGRTLIARSYTQEEYGMFSLSFTIWFIFAVVGTLGLYDGAARQIAYYKGKKENEKVIAVVLYSLLFASATGIILCLLIFFSSDIISNKIFNLPELSYSLKIFSISIPFIVLIYILAAIFRGFGSVKEQAIFMNFLRNLLFILFLFYITWFHFTFKWIAVSFSASIVVTLLIFILYFAIKKPLSFSFRTFVKRSHFETGKKLLIFSVPLLFVAILYQIMSWMDTLMLGYFKTTDIVGLYNAALPLGQFISIALSSILFIYMPIASELYAKNRIYEMKKSYAVLTKWLCIIIFPITIIFVFFPTTVLNFLFGEKYIAAGNALQIIAIGFFIRNLMGPNGAVLMAMGKARFLMQTTLIAAGINVILNASLIPKYSIVGASIATMTAIILMNIIRSIKLYSISKIHTIEKNILKPIVLSVVLVFIIYFIAKNFLTITFWMLPIFFILFIILYGISLLITKSFDKEDIEMLLSIEKKTGINLSLIKRLLK